MSSQPHPLSIAVMGAGSVGCYFGALLARAGHQVTLIGRQSHVQAIAQHGLRLQTATQDLYIPINASTDAANVAAADVVLFCVKSTDTEAAAAQIKPHLAAHAQVLSLQNGVDNDERLRKVLGTQPVAATVVYVATGMAGAGHVRHFGRGELVIAPCPMGDEIARQFSAAGIPTEVSDSVRAALWQKLIINCVYNALSALTQQPYGWLVAQDGADAVMQDIAAECKAVAQADGVALPAGVDAAVAAIARTMPGQLSSTAQDLARGKPTEIDHLNGYVVQPGQALGIATPANRLLQLLVQMKQASADSTIPS
ncbi:ketopantoate reductase family protein [Comamonas testosteroni]|uniref:2-dehydropantoate 2-reductase n=1 Tax=Comamonas testosteroni TaxID=285 RepID=A0A373FLY1_COMTE|nr:ketopantoate reductase family protein [Comamonas testosteroni]RGE45153.1 ketopantoate reductase family protein [Comamonas testosteroni]